MLAYGEFSFGPDTDPPGLAARSTRTRTSSTGLRSWTRSRRRRLRSRVTWRRRRRRRRPRPRHGKKERDRCILTRSERNLNVWMQGQSQQTDLVDLWTMHSTLVLQSSFLERAKNWCFKLSRAVDSHLIRSAMQEWPREEWPRIWVRKVK